MYRDGVGGVEPRTLLPTKPTLLPYMKNNNQTIKIFIFLKTILNVLIPHWRVK